MVRHLRVVFDDEEFARLEEEKGERHWDEAIMEEFGVDDA